MKKSLFLTVTVALITSVGVMGGSIGIIDTAEAGPNAHSRHSLAGRSFQVNVKNLDDGTSNSNCYTFEESGTWIDPLFLEGFVIPGTWIQHTGWPFIRYTAFARTPFPLDLGELDLGMATLRLIQNGTVRPGWRKRSLRLRAYSTAIAEVDDGSDVVIGNFLSTGYSIDACPVEPDPEPT